jgi:acyl carrier protein
MTRAEIQAAVLAALTAVAPELDAATLALDRPLRDQVDLDSMDLLRFVIDLHGRCGVDIPERDYARLSTVTAIVDYLAAAVAARGQR